MCGGELTRGFLSHVPYEFLRAVFHQSIHDIAGVAHGVPFQAQHLQLEQGADLIGQVLEVVIEQEQLFEVCEHADLTGQKGEAVEGEIEHGQEAEVTDVGWQGDELIVVEENFLQMGVVSEEGGSNAFQAVPAEIHGVPGARLFRRRVIDNASLSRAVLISFLARVGGGRCRDGQSAHSCVRTSVEVRLVACQLQSLVLAQVFRIVLVWGLDEASVAVGGAVLLLLHVCWCEVRGGVGESAG